METTAHTGIWDYLKAAFVFDPKNLLVFTHPWFWVFFLVVLSIYALVYKHKAPRNIFLLGVSLFFYYKCSGFFFLLLIFTTLMDFGMGLAMFRAKKKWVKIALLSTSITISLTLLGFFKYSYFIVDSINGAFGTDLHAVNFISLAFNETFGTAFDVDKIILPVGISFFTFQTISYSIDIYRGKIEPVRNIFDYGFFVSFFPQLVMGPIVRASEFLPQVTKPYTITREEFGEAVFQILNGLVKKIFIADFIAVNFLDRVFTNPGMFTGFEHVVAIYGYSLQVYCDFSGYTDIAIGLAKVMGFRLNKNFNSPYKADSVAEFWRRWHMSLSTWLRDYLYQPLGGNRSASFMTYAFFPMLGAAIVLIVGPEYITAVMMTLIVLTLMYMWVTYYFPNVHRLMTTNVNLMITMLFGGLWHGSTWLFVIWGGLNGVALVVHRVFKTATSEEGGNAFNRIWLIVLGSLFAAILLTLLYMGGFSSIGVAFFGIWAGVILSGFLIGWMLRALKAQNEVFSLLGYVTGVFVTLTFISFTRIWFRHETMENTQIALEQITRNFHFELAWEVITNYWFIFSIILGGFIVHWFSIPIKNWYVRTFASAPLAVQVASCVVIVLVLVQMVTAEQKPFIYMAF